RTTRDDLSIFLRSFRNGSGGTKALVDAWLGFQLEHGSSPFPRRHQGTGSSRECRRGRCTGSLSRRAIHCGGGCGRAMMPIGRAAAEGAGSDAIVCEASLGGGGPSMAVGEPSVPSIVAATSSWPLSIGTEISGYRAAAAALSYSRSTFKAEPIDAELQLSGLPDPRAPAAGAGPGADCQLSHLQYGDHAQAASVRLQPLWRSQLRSAQAQQGGAGGNRGGAGA